MADTQTERRIQKRIRGTLPAPPSAEVQEAEGALDSAHSRNFVAAPELGLVGASRMAAASHLESDRAAERLTRADVRERFVKINDYDAWKASGISVYFIADGLDVIKDILIDFFVGICDLLMKTKVTIFESFLSGDARSRTECARARHRPQSHEG